MTNYILYEVNIVVKKYLNNSKVILTMAAFVAVFLMKFIRIFLKLDVLKLSLNGIFKF